MPINNRAEWQREQNREDVRTQHCLDIRAAEATHIEDRAEQRRNMRRIQIEHQGVEMDDTDIKIREYRLFHERQLEQDARFGEAVLRATNDKLVDEKRRQQIRASSEELKQLEAKLRAAYALKELDLQIAEKRLIENKTKKNAEMEKEMQRQLWEQYQKENEQEVQEAALRKRQYGSDLREQLISKDNKKRILYEEFLRDRQIIDAAVYRIHEEDEKAELERLEKVQTTKQEIEGFKEAQAMWREKHRQAMEEENKRIEAYLQKQKMDDEQRKIHTKELQEHKNWLSRQVADKIFAVVEEKREEEELIDMVAEEERLAALEHRRQMDFEKKLQDRAMFREEHQRHLAEKKERLQREALEEKREHQQMVDKLAEDARVDQLTREKQRLKMIQLRHEAQAIIEAKRVQRTEELQQLQKLEEMARKEEQMRLDLIEDERRRMLKEHAKNLLEYMPYGLLHESDIVEKKAVPKEKTNA